MFTYVRRSSVYACVYTVQCKSYFYNKVYNFVFYGFIIASVQNAVIIFWILCDRKKAVYYVNNHFLDKNWILHAKQKVQQSKS